MSGLFRLKKGMDYWALELTLGGPIVQKWFKAPFLKHILETILLITKKTSLFLLL